MHKTHILTFKRRLSANYYFFFNLLQFQYLFHSLYKIKQKELFMPGPVNENEQLKQTSIILAGVNVLLWPFYWADSKLGVIASLVTTVAMIGFFHEVGKQQKSTTTNTVNNFFLPQTDKPIKSAFKNIIEGGSVVCNELTKPKGP
jgi:hypothetical protein